MEAFSDGVIAIIITIMVLELRPPEEVTFEALRPLVPTLLSYLMSFVFLGIYWANHHHMIQAVTKVTGGALWANLHLLFWLSLVPFGTAWMGESHFARAPVAAYESSRCRLRDDPDRLGDRVLRAEPSAGSNRRT